MSDERPGASDQADHVDAVGGLEELGDAVLDEVSGGADGGGQYQFPSGHH